jgi:hypothetical protein
MKQIWKPKLLKTLLGISLLLLLAFTASTIFDSIKLRQNPSLIFPHGDTLSNRTAGTILTGSTIKAKSFISDTMTIPSSTWEVSPNFSYNAYRKISPTIQQAINGITTGVIIIHSGTYIEKLTIKSDISLIGVAKEKVLILTEDDTCCIYGTGITRFSMRDLSVSLSTDIENDTASAIRIRNSYLDSTNTPTIKFYNVAVTTSNISASNIFLYGFKIDSTAMQVEFCSVETVNSTDGEDNADFKLRKSSRAYVYNCQLMVPTTVVTSGIFTMMDSRCRITVADCRMRNAGIMISPLGVTTAIGRIWNNISNGAYTDITNLIGSPNNITDIDFYIR